VDFPTLGNPTIPICNPIIGPPWKGKTRLGGERVGTRKTGKEVSKKCSALLGPR
jgi:hypothetical protein